MAKKSSSTTLKKADAKARTFRMFYPVLAACMLDRNTPPEDVEDEKVERFYDSTLQLTTNDDGVDVAVCEFSAGQKLKQIKILEIQATYFVGLKSPVVGDKNLKAMLEQFVAASAWPMFRDLFIHIGSQSAEELPLLPNVPKLRWKKNEAAQSE